MVGAPWPGWHSNFLKDALLLEESPLHCPSVLPLVSQKVGDASSSQSCSRDTVRPFYPLRKDRLTSEDAVC